MDPEELAALQQKAARADAQATELEALRPKAAAFDALQAAVGDLADEPTRLAGAIADGKAYRDQLVDDIVAGERVMGLVAGDDEAAVAGAKAVYAGASLALLKGRAAALAEKTRGGAGIVGGDPNTTGAGGDTLPDNGGNQPAGIPAALV